MIVVPASFIHDLGVIATILRDDGDSQRALQLLEILLEMLEADAD
ncbi:MAG: hypothetical protein P9F19_11025 [Candidatus Contendobacter sp.]|nr:hypothetical protein [Candidatus Contendobacter sp.]MDG4557900.1 hypothetical protein [Candidatus Contendobacter sp.]